MRVLLGVLVGMGMLVTPAIACNENDGGKFSGPNGHYFGPETFTIAASSGAVVTGTATYPKTEYPSGWGSEMVVRRVLFAAMPVVGTIAEGVVTEVHPPASNKTVTVTASVTAPKLAGRMVEGYELAEWTYEGGGGGCRSMDPLTMVSADLVEVLP